MGAGARLIQRGRTDLAILDMLARAETSSDLQHHDRFCDVDVLGAAGMAASANGAHMAVYRVKYLNDAAEIETAKRVFVMWARRSMINRGIDATGMIGSPGKPKTPSASRVGVQALAAWIHDVCQPCGGLGHQTIAGSPTLSDKQCPHCNGTGKNPIKQPGDIGDVVKDLMERADSACISIQRGVDEKLGRNA